MAIPMRKRQRAVEVPLADPHGSFAAVVDRIATWTNVARTRDDDQVRAGRHAAPAELAGRVEDAVARLEQVAAKLEAAV